MKNIYIEPSVEICDIALDVITASGTDDDEGKWDPRKAKVW